VTQDGAEWWRGATLYQIYPLSFADSNGDGWGDLPGIIDRLDHIASLGVDGIWISPFFCSAWTDFGYDTTDQKAVDPRMGTLADFDRLVERAHAHGLKVLIDQVYTYTSNRHPWFLESNSSKTGDKADWYVWADPKEDGTPPNNWLAIFGGASWAWDTRRRQYYMTHFMPEMPHLRAEHPAVQEALLDIGQFWLDRGVDGFRLDVINLAVVDLDLRDNPIATPSAIEVPAQRQQGVYDASRPEALAFAGRIRSMVDEKPGRFLLGEIAGHAPMATARDYTKGADALHSAYFVLAAASTQVTAAGLRAELEAWSGDGDGWPTWSVGNHDIMRAPTRACGSLPPDDLARMLLAVLMSARGTALLYQGDELGLPDAKLSYEELRDPASRRFYPDFLQRDGARTPMPWNNHAANVGFTTGTPWLPLPESHRAKAVNTQEDDKGSILSLTRALVALRKAEPTLRSGVTEFLEGPETLLRFARKLGRTRIDCLFNVGANPLELHWAVPEGAKMLVGHAAEGHFRLGSCGFGLFKSEA
jgi:alpha-glucosidase